VKTYFGLCFGEDGIDLVVDGVPPPKIPLLIHDSGQTSGGRLRITRNGLRLEFSFEHEGTKQIARFDGAQLSIEGGLESPLFERGVGPVLALLTLPHVVCLHAAAILVRDRAVLFLGESGTGKSSTAHLLASQPGFEFACDDVAVIDSLTRELLLGPRRAWLRGEGVEKTHVDFDDGVPSAPIAAIVRMRREARYSCDLMPSHQAVIEILLASFRLTHIDNTMKERVNRELVQIARHIPVYHFGFPTASTGRPEHLSELQRRLQELG